MILYLSTQNIQNYAIYDNHIDQIKGIYGSNTWQVQKTW